MKLELKENETDILIGNKYIYLIEDLEFNGKSFSSLDKIQNYIIDELNDYPLTIEESTRIVSFEYSNFKHDPMPKLLVIDDDYKFKNGKEVKGQHDILGYNLNYLDKSKENKDMIKGISKILKASTGNKLEDYKEILKQFPNSTKYIRQYKKNAIKNLKLLKLI